MHAGTRIALLILVLGPGTARAQGILEQFSYEGLRLTGLGAEFGAVLSDRLVRTPAVALRVDYGMIAPEVRLMFGASYFRGDFNDGEIAKFETRLRGVILPRDPSYVFDVNVGRIALTDVEASAVLEYPFFVRSRVETYVGLGGSVHVRNGSGDAIDDTFVEDALDTVAAGALVSVGGRLTLSGRLQVTMDMSGGLTSELRTLSARAGLMYRFPAGGGS